MIRKLLTDTMSYTGVYIFYINIVDIATNLSLSFRFDGDLIPFFFLLAIFIDASEQDFCLRRNDSVK